MRRIRRLDLPGRCQAFLDGRQGRVFDPVAAARSWAQARRTRLMQQIVGVLQLMAGDRQRCMYCLDSHGSDVDHFRPKSTYPERTFAWGNLLLSCTECGRMKGSIFPLDAVGSALLIDPTTEEPWDHLDFDPLTCNVVPRFHPLLGQFSPKGQATVRLMRLDRREALEQGRRRAFKRLSSVARAASLDRGALDEEVHARLLDADDFGLWPWVLVGTGGSAQPFVDLWQSRPGLRRRCLGAYLQAFRP